MPMGKIIFCLVRRSEILLENRLKFIICPSLNILLMENRKIIFVALLLVAIVLISGCVRQPIEQIPPPSKEGNVILYENIIDGVSYSRIGNCPYGRSRQETIDLINELNPDFVFRGLYLEPKWTEHLPFDVVEQAGRMLPYINAPVQGAVNLKGFYRYDKWSDGRTITEDEFNEMVVHDENGNPVLAYGDASDQYLADMKSNLYRDFIMDRVKRFANNGFKHMFFDEPKGSLSTQPINEFGGRQKVIENWDEFKLELNEDINIYWKDIADRTHALGMKVTTNSGGGAIGGGVGRKQGLNLSSIGPMPYLDIVTFAIDVDEDMKITSDLEAIRNAVNEKYGNDMQIMTFLDWGFSTDTALARFTAMSSEEQSGFLIYAIEETNKHNIDFVIPVHGGWPGPGSMRPSYDFEACCPEAGWCYDIEEKVYELMR